MSKNDNFECGCSKCGISKLETLRPKGDPEKICDECQQIQEEEEKRERYKEEARNMSETEVRDALADIRYKLYEKILPQFRFIQMKNTVFGQ